MRSNIKGISLIELLIVVILISTLATAYLNLRDNFGVSTNPDSVLSPVDSVRYSILDEIALNLRLARCASYEEPSPVTIEHLGETDRIKIRHNKVRNEYLVDGQGRLILLANNNRKTLSSGIVSLRAREMGEGTIVLTITTRPSSEIDTLGSTLHSYSKVVTVNFPLENGWESAKRPGH